MTDETPKVKKHAIISAAVKPEMKIAIDQLAERKGVTRSVLINMFLQYAMDQYETAESERFREVVHQP